MLLFVMVTIVIMMISFILLDRTRMSILVSCLCTGLLLVIFSYILIWTKYGGTRPGIRFVLYLTPGIGRRFLYWPISAASLSILLNFGKSLFLCGCMLLTVYLCKPSRKITSVILSICSVLIPLFFYILLYPPVYELYWNTPFFRVNQVSIFNIMRTGYAVCLLFCIVMLLRQYRHVRIAWVKRGFYYIILLIVYLFILFFMFAILGPVQVSHFTGINYITSNFLYMNGYVFWIIVLICSVFFTVSGTRALWMYSQVYRSIGQPDISISKRMKDNNAGVRMFIHGIKNQVLVLRNMVTDIQKDIALPKDVQEKLHGVYQTSEGMLNHIDELYKAFKNKQVTLIKVDAPSEIARRALSKIPQDRIPVRLVILQEEPLLADEVRLSEVLYNIVVNGIEAVLAKDRVSPSDYVELRIYSDRADLVFEVVDTGTGINKKELRRIFEPFFTSKNAKTNWGMGLSYAQEIVKAHYGKISIESKPGYGTNIYVSIPIYNQ